MQTAAVTPQAASSGAYVVQIAANKTQEEATSAFRSAQARYPSVLGNRKLMIRKKEIAGKGTFYGAQVGPFASRADASQLCEDLKSAGGSCIVQRN
jgi:cell division septation protein DedD